jgi:glycosyltransferase involved in cell wall biosynthesis
MTLMRVPEDGSPIDVAECSRVIGPGFSESFALPAMPTSEPALLRCVVEEHQVENDHRPFGLLLEAAAVLYALTNHAHGTDAKIEHLAESQVDLTEEHERRFREENFEQWVETLVQLALARPDEVETDFAMVRGPHSPAMQGWLAENAERYDTVLVQGIPFDLIPSTVATLRALREPPRIVTLPHFHSDDRFYYWRRYFDSFEAADQTLLFSSSINGIVGASERFRVVPGGGVSPTEYANVASRHRFAQVHKREAPFFLVLGRKTASKGYEQVMRAHRALRDQGANVELVLIGPDEDGAPIHGDGVHYLGQQPREIVLGALAECLAVVTMSSSESFGIVLCEAWMSGKPVIANRACYSFRELVKDGETGLLVRTTSDLAAAMERLATNSAERDRMGQAGRAEAISRYTWGRVADDVYDALARPEAANTEATALVSAN